MDRTELDRAKSDQTEADRNNKAITDPQQNPYESPTTDRDGFVGAYPGPFTRQQAFRLAFLPIVSLWITHLCGFYSYACWRVGDVIATIRDPDILATYQRQAPLALVAGVVAAVAFLAGAYQTRKRQLVQHNEQQLAAKLSYEAVDHRRRK